MTTEIYLPADLFERLVDCLAAIVFGDELDPRSSAVIALGEIAGIWSEAVRT